MKDTSHGASSRAFENVFLPHLNAAFGLARWLMHNDADAEDCVQDAYLRAYKAYPRFRGEDGKAWLLTILRNVCFTALKKKSGQGAPESFDEEIHHTVEQTAATAGAPDRSEVLRRAIENLPPEFREMIVLHDLEGRAYREIALIVNVPIGTVMSRLARAREKLRSQITREEGSCHEV